jgi:hypothetical protein
MAELFQEIGLTTKEFPVETYNIKMTRKAVREEIESALYKMEEILNAIFAEYELDVVKAVERMGQFKALALKEPTQKASGGEKNAGR